MSACMGFSIWLNNVRIFMAETDSKPACGIVMPISGMEGCSESHRSDMLDIVTEAIDEAGFKGTWSVTLMM